MTLLRPVNGGCRASASTHNIKDQKIGSHIHSYIDEWWLEHGNGVVRLMTSSQRVQVHHLCEKLGYTKILEVKELEAETTR